MRTLRFLLNKEFRQVFRNPSILRIIFMMPMIQLLLLPWAADYEVKDIRITVVDHDHSEFSKQLTDRVTASGYFRLRQAAVSYHSAMDDLREDHADLILSIPSKFEHTLVRENRSELFVSVNAINGSRASLGASYLQSIINAYTDELRQRYQLPSPGKEIRVIPNNRFNRSLNYKVFMVPGIVVILVTMVGSFLAALNIVKEKESGTIEQINVTPVKKYQFILGKLIPFWVLGLLILTVGLIISRIVYGIIPLGSILTIYVFASVYLLAVLGLGLLVSTYASTQQQAMLISFFLLMIFILLSGLYTSIDSMPGWARQLTRLNPVTYFIEVMRMVVLKGSNVPDILPQLTTIFGFAVILNGWAIFSYRKTS